MKSFQNNRQATPSKVGFDAEAGTSNATTSITTPSTPAKASTSLTKNPSTSDDLYKDCFNFDRSKISSYAMLVSLTSKDAILKR